MSHEEEAGALLLRPAGGAAVVGVGARVDRETSERELEEWAEIFDALFPEGKP